jgi:hypothetical protein
VHIGSRVGVRAVRSRFAGERSWVYYIPRQCRPIADFACTQKDALQFLSSFAAACEYNTCSGCEEEVPEFQGQFSVTWCIDCNARYYLCHLCVEEQFLEVPVNVVNDSLSRRLNHGGLSSAAQHTHLCFGRRHFPSLSYGVESALSKLGDWYARNTNGVDAALD